MEIIDDISRKTLFYYVVIFVFILFIFSMVEIKLNIVFGTIIGAVLMIYLYYNEEVSTQKLNSTNVDKIKSIVPPIKTTSHSELVDFLFSIQDLYVYNQRSYESMVENIDRFFSLYDEAKINNYLAGRNYELMKTQKRMSINFLMQINFGMRPNSEYDSKLKHSVRTLNSILDKYMVEVYRIYQNELYLNGYNSQTVLVNNYDITAYNTYNDKIISYEIF